MVQNHDTGCRGTPVLSVLIPAYNEEKTLKRAIDSLFAVDWPAAIEVVVVDDGSADSTPEILRRASVEYGELRAFRHQRNRGKGAAIRSAAAKATGDNIVIFDADLEYDPEDLVDLLNVVLSGRASVVYGTRTFGSHSSFSFWYVLGNKAVTLFANVLFDCYLSDLETCFKLMPRRLYQYLNVRSDGFGMEAEITGRLLRNGIRPYEAPISYKARSRAEGKKITVWDGVKAVGILLATRVERPRMASSLLAVNRAGESLSTIGG